MFIFVATAMKNVFKGKAKYFLASMPMLVLITVTLASTHKSINNGRFDKNLTTDTIPTPVLDSTPKKIIVTPRDTIPFVKDSLNRNDSRFANEIR